MNRRSFFRKSAVLAGCGVATTLTLGRPTTESPGRTTHEPPLPVHDTFVGMDTEHGSSGSSGNARWFNAQEDIHFSTQGKTRLSIGPDGVKVWDFYQNRLRRL